MAKGASTGIPLQGSKARDMWGNHLRSGVCVKRHHVGNVYDPELQVPPSTGRSRVQPTQSRPVDAISLSTHDRSQSTAPSPPPCTGEMLSCLSAHPVTLRRKDSGLKFTIPTVPGTVLHAPPGLAHSARASPVKWLLLAHFSGRERRPRP